MQTTREKGAQMLDAAAPATCEQCNTHPVTYTEAKLCARCALRNFAAMVRRDGAPEAADMMLKAIHDSIPQEWVESGFMKYMAGLDANA